MKLLKQLLIVPGISLLLISPVQADILGVEDAALLAEAMQQLEQLQKTYTKASEQYNATKSILDKTKAQLDVAKKQIEVAKNLNSGSYGFGKLGNSLSDLTERKWSPGNWDDALKNIAGGNKLRYQKLVKAYKRSHATIDTDKMKKNGASESQIKQVKQDQEVNQAVVVQSTYAYNDIAKHLDAVHKLSQKIEETKNTKGALDLNSRLVAEMAYIQIQTLKLQTLLSQQAAQSNSNQITQTSEQVSFNRLPDNA